MGLRRRYPGLLLVVAAAWLPAANAAVEVELRLLAPDAVEVAYTLPPQCQALAFIKNGEEGRATRALWQPAGTAAAGADQLSRGNDPAAVLRFRVPAATRQPGYPAAFPMGQAIYVHLSNYAVADSCGKVAYRLSAPGVAVNGRAFGGSAMAQSGDDAALLLEAPPRQHGSAAPDHFDPRLPAAAVAQIRKVADGTADYLRQALPGARFTRPIVAATVASEPGGPNIGGDAADVLRLTLFNWPANPGPAEEAKVTLLVSHEFSHRFQLRDAVDTYPDARLIHEGGAEFLRWMTSVQRGWMTPAQAADDLDRALAECILATDQQSWRALTPEYIGRNWLAYKCGLPAYVYTLAARHGRGTAMARVDGFYTQLRRGAKPDFGHALECGAAAACRAGSLAALLEADGPMERQWTALLRRSGLATPQPPTQAQRDAMVLKALVKLMKDDCGGRSGTTPTPGSVIFDGMKSCKTFTRDQEATSIEGRPLFGDAATGQAMTAACNARHQLVLGLKDGGTLAVPCAEPYRMREAFYRADITKILAALGRK